MNIDDVIIFFRDDEEYNDFYIEASLKDGVFERTFKRKCPIKAILTFKGGALIKSETIFG